VWPGITLAELEFDIDLSQLFADDGADSAPVKLRHKLMDVSTQPFVRRFAERHMK
jgi:hypothetical protein